MTYDACKTRLCGFCGEFRTTCPTQCLAIHASKRELHRFQRWMYVTLAHCHAGMSGWLHNCKCICARLAQTGVRCALKNRRHLYIQGLASDHLFDMLRITIAFQFNLRSGAVDLAQIVWCEFNCHRSDIFFQTMQPRRSWDGNNPGFLGE